MYGFIITTAGMDMLARAVLGEPITITGVQVGKGVVSDMETARTLTALISPVANGTSTKPKVSNTQISMIVEYRNDMNDGLTEAFDLYEFGIFAKISNQQPTLLYYATLGNAPHKVQPISAGLDVHRFPVTIEVTNDVVVTLGYPAGAFLTEDEKGSPGGVAELDSGGAVPSEQMPGYAVTSGVCAMGQNCPGGPLMLDNIQGNTVLGGTPAYNAPVSIKSVERPLKLHISGKNLIDISKATKTGTASGVSYSISDDGAISLSGVCDRPGSSAYIMPFGDGISKAFHLPAGTYYLSGLNTDYSESKAVYLYLNCYNGAGEAIVEPKPAVYGPAGTGFAIPEGGAWVTVNVAVKDGTDVAGMTITPQIEVGNQATDYEQPSNTTVEIPLLGTDGQELEPLRMAYGGNSSTKTAYYDRIVRRNGVWCIERSVAERALTDAVWVTGNSYATPYFDGSGLKDGAESYLPFCTHFPPRAGAAAGQDTGVWVGNRLVVGNQVLPNGAQTTAEELKSFCAAQAEAGTPVIVVYALKTPVYEELHQDVQVILNTLSVSGGTCSVWFEGDILPSGADIGLPRGDYPCSGVEGAYRWLDELSNPLPTPTTDDLYAWALSQQRGGVFATDGSTTTKNVPEAGNLTGILFVTEQGSAVSMIVFGPTGKLHTASRIAGVWRGWTTLYSSLSKPTPAEIGAIPTTQKGAASGVATLDSGKKIPVEQIPNLEYDSAGSASKVQTALTQHTSNKNNPHGVTAAQVGAAATSHKHSTSDITGGTLPVSRGGTGVSSLTGTDYGTYRVRGIAISDTIPSSISNGQICLVY